ncbi:hypothetical protein L3V82_08175 [Thiotrichales bacterium 19S3-7]|nr:hypothetical protein [Thiotrichales bacterium 19S3-7]MCF6802231.1 hypothetical protein [Thiotrichales bacterium 19S3-11]
MAGIDIKIFDDLITQHTNFPRIGKGRHAAISKATGIPEQTIKGWYSRGVIPEFQLKKIQEKCNIQRDQSKNDKFIFNNESNLTASTINVINEHDGFIKAKIEITLPTEFMLELIRKIRELESKVNHKKV